jgi:hypothetical protein
MAKIKISQFDTDPANNTDIDGINLAEGMAPGLVNNAIRTLMAQLKNQLTGTDDDNRTIGGNLVVDGTSTLTGNSTVGGTLAVTGNTTFSGTLTVGSNLTAATADILGVATLNSLVVATTAAVANLTATSEISAPVVRATTKFIFADGSEQVTAATTGFTAGTVMLFVQTSAPTGWVKSTAHDNKALRVVSGTAGAGGSVAFTTAFASQAVLGTNGSVGATTLTTAQIPSHTHTYNLGREAPNTTGFLKAAGSVDSGYNETLPTNATGGGGSHTHTASAFTGTAINLAVQYVDVIICTKS